NLRLIDYDGMYVPALSDQAPGEVGHRAYQHRQRLNQGGYGPEIDRFSHLLIYTTLRCLIVGGRALWDRHYDEDRLLLGPQDLAAPDQSPVFRDLWRLDDPAARNLVGHLALAAHGRLEDVPLLEEVLRDRKVVALTRNQEQQVEQWLSTGGPSAQIRPSREQEPAKPPPMATIAPAPAPVVVTCVCGQSFAAAPHLFGQQMPCPMCGWPLDIPAAPGGTAKTPLETSLADDDPLDSVLPPAASRPLTRTPFRAQPRRGEANPFMELAGWAKPRWPLLTALGGGVLTVILLLSLVAGVWRGSESLPVATGVAQTGSDSLTQASTEAAAARERAEETDSLVMQCNSAIATADQPAAELLLAKLEKLAPQDSRLTDLRQAWGRLPISNSIGMKLRLIPAGEFLMGSSETPEALAKAFESYGKPSADRFNRERPQHPVRITKPFYLGVHEVTVGQFGRFVRDKGYKTEGERNGKGGYGLDAKGGEV
ncbi:MAG: SUMF1/EgtB/PvdO family nonheme iron enzyme, partial [Planctomycetota bacterium]|nr:SUMF1/EgtB/PvdO family nonheme iron enzyme [Planctomycetota bacterium]